MAGPRSWYANMRARPRFIVHLQHEVTAGLPATAAPPVSSEPPPVDRYCAGHPIALKTATGSR